MKWGRVKNYKSTRKRQDSIKLRLKIAEGCGIPYSYLFNNKGLSKDGIKRLNKLTNVYNNAICNILLKKLPRKLKKKYKRKFIL